MIIRKLAEALRLHNWVTVVLEVLIVVIGIFIALQVDDWKSGREDRIEEVAYLQRLRVQMHNNEVELSELAPSLSERMKAVNYALGSLDGNPQDIDAQRFQIALGQTMNLWVVNLETDVYEEMVSTGKLNLISSIALREELAGYLADIDAMNKVDSIGTFDFFHSDYVPFLLEHFNMQPIFDGWYTEWMQDMYRSKTLDPVILRLDPHDPLKIQLRNNLVYLYSTLAWMRHKQEQFLDRTRRIQSSIQSQLDPNE